MSAPFLFLWCLFLCVRYVFRSIPLCVDYVSPDVSPDVSCTRASLVCPVCIPFVSLTRPLLMMALICPLVCPLCAFMHPYHTSWMCP